MTTIKQTKRYQLLDTRKDDAVSANYIILENYEPSFSDGWRTCGEYFNKKDALSDFNKFTI